MVDIIEIYLIYLLGMNLMYSDFAEIYNKLVFDIDYNFYADTIKKEIEKNKIVPKNILEIGIGTGNLTKKIDYKVGSYIGVDLSSEMLEIASNKLTDKENLTLVNADIADFKMDNNFNVAISTLDTINYILDPKNLEKAFKNIYESLESDSVFIFDINSENKLIKVLGNNSYIYEYENVFYTWQSFYDEKEGIVDFVLDFFVEENGKYKRITEEQSEKVYSIKYITELLKRVGFAKVTFTDFDNNKEVEEETQRILFTAIKY